jgi:phenylpropionate dioxygenase-like ring-hydroxylating dioxygenase large terminal subunit
MNDQATRHKSRRERTREIGQNGNYWYAVELSKNLKPKKALEVIFWKTPIAIYRGEDGQVRALENRCAHRQLRLTTGVVKGNDIICQYHGWTYDGCGKCAEISHEIGQRKDAKVPDIRIQHFPAQEKYGLIWVFMGDPELAEKTEIPRIPQLEGDNPWKFIPIDITINSHYSMVLENVCDFNHAFLHRDYRPFTNPHLRKHFREEDCITMEYETDLSQSQVVKIAGDNQGKDFEAMTLWYNYPFQASNIEDKYLHWLFMVPVDERTTRCFFIFLFGALEIPVVRWNIPQFMCKPLLWAINKFYVIPLLGQDLWALEEEQLGHDRHGEETHYEFNPIVSDFQKMSLEKWEQYIASEAERYQKQKAEKKKWIHIGAGLTRKDIKDYLAQQEKAKQPEAEAVS